MLLSQVHRKSEWENEYSTLFNFALTLLMQNKASIIHLKDIKVIK